MRSPFPFAALLAALALAAGRTAHADPATAPPTDGSVQPASADAPTQAQLNELRARIQALESERNTRAAAAPGAPAAPAAPEGDSAFSPSDFAPRVTPFSGDFAWTPAGYAPRDTPLNWGPFKGEIRVDVPFHYSFARPVDNTIAGSSEVFRHNEFQVTQLGVGGDFYFKGAHARFMTQFGSYSQTTPRNDPSGARGQWNLADAYRYISEAYAGYHIDKLAGINVQAGIFMSYIGLWSYYNFDNWTYQPSYVSSNTPWFFNGARAQIYVTPRLKIEPWLVNGWQSYGKFNQAPGVGLQIKWAPSEAFVYIGNHYFGTDTLGTPDRLRLHTDNSIMARWYNNPTSDGLSKGAVSLTVDAGCEFGGTGTISSGTTTQIDCSRQYFIGFMAYARAWFVQDRIALTLGGGAISNPGRYLVLTPPINGATAYTGFAGVDRNGRAVWTQNPGDRFNAWDTQVTLDYMPTRNVTFRLEYTHRAADVPYFAGRGGMTPPNGAGGHVNQGAPGSAVEGWSPDLVRTENRITLALLFRL